MADQTREHLLAIVLIGAGGFVGAVSRYGIDIAAGMLVDLLLGGAAVPLGTLVVNVGGSFALGALTRVLSDRRLRLFLATGLLSSFTTYSTFAVETVQLGPRAGAANALATYGLGLLAAIAGLTVSLGTTRGGTR